MGGKGDGVIFDPIYTGRVPSSIKSYSPTWEGDLLLACRKCQKKLKGAPDMRALARLKKTIKRHNKKHPDALFHVIGVPCMDMCPTGAVTVCIPGNRTAELLLIRSEDEIEGLYQRD